MQNDLNPVALAKQIEKALKRLEVMSIKVQHCARLDATAVVADYCIAEAGL
jgi:UDP-N-acetylglucosamine--N-acetylmuramyl-(pentapeptide) pyrophosphoryl-undecaprenol N-acetylglucosamine transferase